MDYFKSSIPSMISPAINYIILPSVGEPGVDSNSLMSKTSSSAVFFRQRRHLIGRKEKTLSDSLRLSLRLKLSIGQFEPISGLSWPHFLHI